MTKKLTILALLVVLGLGLTTYVLAESTVLLNAAGATFPYPMYSKWFDMYRNAHPNVQINYAPIGSGGGIRQILAGTVDFGASDGPMTDDQINEFKQKRGMEILHFPTVLGAAVPSYNIPGVTAKLNFTQSALTGIYLGTITKWNDPQIANANPGVNLPANDIVVVHRSDGSGTTYIWTDFLSKASSDWKSKVGTNTSVNWPVGLGGKGNEGVSGLVTQTPNAIGYVELIYAIQNHIDYGNVQNASGKYINADLASVSEAASGAARNMPEDFRVSITNAPGATAYPISSFTWLLIPARIDDAAKREAIKDFLKWMITDGQNYTEALSYARLPKPVQTKELAAIAKIQ
ncbi:MAG: phosphate ABC transporter substrate-binding protein PstS [Candidatus Acidiferrales bacterium]